MSLQSPAPPAAVTAQPAASAVQNQPPTATPQVPPKAKSRAKPVGAGATPNATSTKTETAVTSGALTQPESHQSPVAPLSDITPPSAAAGRSPLTTSSDSAVSPNVPPDSVVRQINRSYFTIGSTKDEVLAVQGTPTKKEEYQWSYGLSVVDFDRYGHVASWTVRYGNPMRVKMVPSTPVSSTQGYFTLGSTKDEVLVVQGTPTAVGEYQWSYGLSTVEFDRSGRVTSWTIRYGNPLRAKMLPSTAVSNSPGYFTVGSTKDEVLVVQGTPTEVGEYRWEYGASTVDFDRNGRVISWTTRFGNPLKARQ